MFGFGNSGGLDSRLIGIYAKQFGLPITSFITGERKPFKILDSTSFIYSDKLAKFMEVKNHPVEYVGNEYFYQALLDIRNNPLGMSQIFKNPVHRVPAFDKLLVGHPGIIVGGMVNEFLEHLSLDDLVTYMFDYFTVHKFRFSLMTRRPRTILRVASKRLLGKKYRQDNILSRLFSDTEIADYKIHMRTYVENRRADDNFSIRQRYASTVLERWQFGGGFESLTRTKPAYYLYYPFSFDGILCWPEHFVVRRSMLKEILRRKSAYLGSLPEQHGGSRLSLLTRGTGLDYWKWTLKKEFQAFSKQVLRRPNDLFDSAFPESEKWSPLVLRSPLAIEIVKIKLLLDIIHSDRIKQLISLEDSFHELQSLWNY